MPDKNYDIPDESRDKPESDLEKARKKELKLRKINHSIINLEEALEYPLADKDSIIKKLVLLSNYDPKLGETWRKESRKYGGFLEFDFYNLFLNGVIKSALNKVRKQREKYFGTSFQS